MKYSNMFMRPMRWAHDEQGTLSYNILGGLECALINLNICDKISESWGIDDMERFGFKFTKPYERSYDIYGNQEG